jgi:hypothetical protein
MGKCTIRNNYVSIFRACDAKAWGAKFVLLKELRDKHGNFTPRRDDALASWLTRQKRLSSRMQLDPIRCQKLEELGVDLSRCTAKSIRCESAKRTKSAGRLITKKLKDYHHLHGHGNVPRRHKEDPALGN